VRVGCVLARLQQKALGRPSASYQDVVRTRTSSSLLPSSERTSLSFCSEPTPCGEPYRTIWSSRSHRGETAKGGSISTSSSCVPSVARSLISPRRFEANLGNGESRTDKLVLPSARDFDLGREVLQLCSTGLAQTSCKFATDPLRIPDLDLD
jgi:hypothetical protein